MTRLPNIPCNINEATHRIGEGSSQRGLSSSSLAWSLAFMIACALSLLSLCTLFMVPPALAATWPLPASALSASVGFHQSYSAGSRSYVHSGIDIPASAGMQISAPLAGKVRFTGAVPSGDSKVSNAPMLKTMDAVSIELDDGRALTLMPFASIFVREGQAVSEGQLLGTVAASGDASSLSPHVHMGYKEGSVYLDPMTLFGMSTSSSSASSAREPRAIPEIMSLGGASMPEAVVEDSVGNVREGIGSESLAPQGQHSMDPVSPEAFEETFNSIETGHYVPKARQSVHPSPLDAVRDALDGIGAACADQLASFTGALSALSKGTGIPLNVLLATATVLATAASVALGFACVRFLVPFVYRAAKDRLFAGSCHAAEEHLACH